jgi:2-dehydropantoate 2-reductase
MKFEKICIYGVGAIGGWIGARLAQLKQIQLSAVARGETLTAIQKSGLNLLANETHSAFSNLKANIHVCADPTELGVQDLVIITVKGTALSEVALRIAPLIGKNTVVLSAMNGVPWWFFNQFGGNLSNSKLTSIDPKGMINRHIPDSNIMGCVVHASCSVQSAGCIQHHFGNGLIVGEPSGHPSERAIALHALFCDAGFDTTLSEQIQKDIWYKLWGNMSVNPVSVLTGATTDKILADQDVRAFLSTIMLEAKAIGERMGIPMPQDPEDRHAITSKLGAFKTSMLQDLEHQRPLELDQLVSAVVELGQLCEVPTPFTKALLGLTRLKAQVLGLYP